MKNIITIICLLISIISFSQEDFLHQELQIYYQKSTIVPKPILEVNSDIVLFNHSKFRGIGVKYKYYTKYKLLSIGFLY